MLRENFFERDRDNYRPDSAREDEINEFAKSVDPEQPAHPDLFRKSLSFVSFLQGLHQSFLTLSQTSPGFYMSAVHAL